MSMRIAGSLLTFLILLGCESLQAQHYIGIRGGWGGGSARFTPVKEGGTEWGLYSGGISYKFFTAEKFVGGIQADLQYMGRGFTYNLRTKGDSSYHRTINSFELPLMWQPHFYIAQRHVRVFFNLGVYLSYFLDSKEYYKSKQAGIYEQGKYEMKLTRDPKWGYGLCGGGGLSFLIRRFEIAMEGRYYFGYSDVLRNGTKYDGNPAHSPLDNLNFSMGFYYRLSKEGIRAAPSKAVARRMQEALVRKANRALEKAQKNGVMPDSLSGIPPVDSTASTIQPFTSPAPDKKEKKETVTPDPMQERVAADSTANSTRPEALPKKKKEKTIKQTNHE